VHTQCPLLNPRLQFCVLGSTSFMAGQHPPSPEITDIAPGAGVEVDRDDGHHVFAEMPSR